jgi:hypothetical protein
MMDGDWRLTDAGAVITPPVLPHRDHGVARHHAPLGRVRPEFQRLARHEQRLPRVERPLGIPAGERQAAAAARSAGAPLEESAAAVVGARPCMHDTGGSASHVRALHPRGQREGISPEAAQAALLRALMRRAHRMRGRART